ncbi:MAG: acylglycerol kinase family protein [Candidatus Hydrogenedentes bacterium]|nr:acylglycerol kinase family protein [Candidatus Hydrogenedentota bacterium]
MTTREKCALVVNPAAGNGRTGRLLKRFAGDLKTALGEYSVLETQGPGEAATLTRKALRDGFTRIVSAGGDGTCYEVVNGFFEDGKPISPGASLALLPLGTGMEVVSAERLMARRSTSRTNEEAVFRLAVTCWARLISTPCR